MSKTGRYFLGTSAILALIAISLAPGAAARGKGKGQFAAQIAPGTISLSCRHRGRVANRVQISAQVAYSDVRKELESRLKTREGRAVLHLSVRTSRGKVLARVKGRARLRLKVRGNRIYHTNWFLLAAKPSQRVLHYAYGSGDCRLLHRNNRQLRVELNATETVPGKVRGASLQPGKKIRKHGTGGGGGRLTSLRGHRRHRARASSHPKLSSPALTACPPYPCLETAAQVLNWKESEARLFDKAVVPLAKRVPTPGPRLLVGLDDGPWAYWSSFDLPSQGSSSTGNVYNFSHWQYVDSLYYYSHHLLSVPPTVWTDAAHRNGVSVLGTVTGDCSFCGPQMNKLFEKHPTQAVERLYQLASAYGFDGWMIDVENGATYSPQLLWAMERLRKGNPPGRRPLQVVTYTAGAINLSPGLLPAFEAAGEWQADYYHAGFTHAPQQTFELLEQHPPLADQRFSTYWATDVYRPYGENGPERCLSRSSADWVWNGFRCNHVKVLFANLGSARAATDPPGYFQSLSLFAPAWTEFAGHNQTTAPRPPRPVFQEADERFWSGVGGYRLMGNACTLATQRQNSVSSLLTPRSSLTRIPFSTRFDTGEGDGFAVAGEPVVGKEKEWNFLAAQDALPSEFCSESGDLSAEIDYKDAYDGGSSLLVTGSVTTKARRLYLYEAQAKLPNRPGFVLRYRGEGPEPRVAVWIGEKAYDLKGEPEKQGEWTTIQSVLPENAQGKTLTRIGVWFNPKSSPERVKARIGELAVVDLSSYAPPQLITPVAEPAEKPVQLSWDVPSPTIQYYNVWAAIPEAGSAETGSTPSECASFVGRALMPHYDLGQPLFAFPDGTTKFLVQPIDESGLPARLSLSPCRR